MQTGDEGVLSDALPDGKPYNPTNLLFTVPDRRSEDSQDIPDVLEMTIWL